MVCDNLLIGSEFLCKRKRKQLIYFQNILRKMIVIFLFVKTLVYQVVAFCLCGFLIYGKMTNK